MNTPLIIMSVNPKDITNLPPYDPNDTFLQGLAKSIADHGLWYPPIIKENSRSIVSGSKRVAASIMAGLSVITCSAVPDGQPEEYYSTLRLHENLKRKNLPWYEEILLEKQLHDIYIKQFGQRGTGGAGTAAKKTGSGWSLRQTAAELEMSFGVLSEDLRMAEAIMADPTLKRIEDKKTARKVIFESYKRLIQEQDSGADVDAEINVVHCGGAESILQVYPGNTFDACITDPPWLKFKDASLTKDQYTLDVFRQVYRVLKRNSFLYTFVSTPDFFIYQQAFKDIGFSVSDIPLIWIKEGVLTHGTRSWEYQRDYEPILLAVKGSPSLTSPMLSAVSSCKVIHSSKLVHPNEKPPEIIKRLIDHCTYENALILDPFAGSGVVGDCAHQMGRDYVMIEKDTKFAAQIISRMNK